MAESTYLEDLETGNVSKHCRFFKMKVLEAQDSEAIDKEVKKSIDQETIVFSDKNNSYLRIEDYVEAHVMEKSSKETTVETLRWVHIAISNAKRNFLGVYHKIKRKYLQNYLNEFVYKLNRRYFKSIFERLVIACLLI
jgi:transposase-like protein